VYGAHGRWWAAAADAARWPFHECGDEEFRWGGGRYGKRRSSRHSLPNSNSSPISLSLSHMFGRPAVAMEAEADVRRVTAAEADRAAGCGGGGAARPGSERPRRRRTGRSAAKAKVAWAAGD
jgi:hypothetical protein